MAQAASEELDNLLTENKNLKNKNIELKNKNTKLEDDIKISKLDSISILSEIIVDLFVSQKHISYSKIINIIRVYKKLLKENKYSKTELKSMVISRFFLE